MLRKGGELLRATGLLTLVRLDYHTTTSLVAAYADSLELGPPAPHLKDVPNCQGEPSLHPKVWVTTQLGPGTWCSDLKLRRRRSFSTT